MNLVSALPETRIPAAHVPVYADLAIYDDVLPSPASPFRTLEYGHYLDFFPSSVLVSMEAYHFDFAHAGLGDLAARLPIEERLKERIFGLEAARDLVPRLAYVTFLGNAQRLLPYFQARRIPFILQLYPGGSFEPGVPASDDHLRAVAHSPLCRRIIATQKITQQHLIERIGCDPAKIEMIYGGVYDSRVGFDFSRDKLLYGTHKDTIDICFVAHRYGDDMAQKGYDQFVEVARILAADPRIRFHVVGDYGPEHLPLGDAAPRFVFHGAQPNAFFAGFYPQMDVILSANRPANGGRGAFDGFPTGACMEAGFRGVLNCVTDPLDLNIAFEDGRDILIVQRDAERTARRLAALFADPPRLYELARANWQRFREVFDVDRQLWARTRLIVAELLREEALVARPAVHVSALAATTEAVASFRYRLDAMTAECQRLESVVDTLVEENRKLGNACEEATTYGNNRHDALLAEYNKLAAGFEALRSHADRRAEALQSRSIALPPDPAQGGEGPAEREAALLAEIARLQAPRPTTDLARTVLKRVALRIARTLRLGRSG